MISEFGFIEEPQTEITDLVICILPLDLQGMQYEVHLLLPAELLPKIYHMA